MSLRPRSLLAQVAWLAVAALILAQVAGFWLFSAERGSALRVAQRIETIERAARLAELLQAAPPATHADMIEAAASRAVRFDLAPAPLVAAEDYGTIPDWPQGRIREVARPPHDVYAPPGLSWLRDLMMRSGFAPSELRLSLPVAGDRWLNATARFERPGVQLPPQILGSTLLTLFLILAALWLGLRRIAGPLEDLARAAESIGLDGPPPAMPESGPREVRALSAALARMQARLTKMVSDRTRMLAALGHDLRSPITALRLRAEMVEDEETRTRMVAALDEMQQMAEATLAYARGVSPDAPMEEVELSALLAGRADDLSASGPPVTVAAARPVILPLRRVAMRRALRNLLENAQRYGGGAAVTIEQGPGAVRILIDDTGPGIPDQDLERVFDPFERLETSRSRETGGAGLGLPIARSIIEAHGGQVTLENRVQGGLRAVVRLSVRSAD